MTSTALWSAGWKALLYWRPTLGAWKMGGGWSSQEGDIWEGNRIMLCGKSGVVVRSREFQAEKKAWKWGIECLKKHWRSGPTKWSTKSRRILESLIFIFWVSYGANIWYLKKYWFDSTFPFYRCQHWGSALCSNPLSSLEAKFLPLNRECGRQ